MRGATRKPTPETAYGLLGPLAATTSLLGVLLLWARTYEQSCLALASPGLVYVAVFWGLLEYRLERRRFAIDYYLDGSSSWRRLFRRWWLPAAICLVAAFPLAVFLSVFAALARPPDWLFLAGASLLAPPLFSRLAVWPGRHFRRAAGGGILAGPAEILTSRLAGHLLLGLVVIAYVHLNYSVIPGPPNIFAGNPLTTGETFAAQVHSACPVVETGLRSAAGLNGVAWAVVTDTASEQRMPDGAMKIVWAALFLNAALAMTGFVRGLEGVNLLTRRVAPGTGPKRPGAGMRGAILLLVPLTVLAAVGYHALQLQVEERWSAKTHKANWPEFHQAIDGIVETAFAPAHAAVPDMVDRYYSIAGLSDQLTTLVGKDEGLVSELNRRLSSARKVAVEGVYGELHEKRVAELARLFSRDLGALPPWLRSAYGWFLDPVHARVKSSLANAVHHDPSDVLREIERAAETANYPKQVFAFMEQIGGTVLGMFGLNHGEELLRRRLDAVVEEDKDRTKARLLRAVETVVFTPREDFVPSGLRPASQ